MGAWGPKLYQDDLAQDVRDEFKDMINKGISTENATKDIIKQYLSEIEDIDEAPIFWFALADTQWEYGKLLPSVKKEAIDWIDKGTDQQRWLLENNKYGKTRTLILEMLKEKLNSPMPAEKKIKPVKVYKCEWKIGDIFAYNFMSNYANEHNFNGKYLCFIKVGEISWHPGHVIPKVCVYNYIFDNKPDINTVINKEVLPQFFNKEAYLNHPDLKKRFQLALLSTSKKIIPQNLYYLGNNQSIELFEINEKDIFKVSWKEFEKYVIDQYLEWRK